MPVLPADMMMKLIWIMIQLMKAGSMLGSGACDCDG